MNKIVGELRKELCMLNEIEEKASNRLKNAPLGHLRVTEKRGKAQYYYSNSQSSNVRERESNGRYVRKSEYELARTIIQRDYDLHFVNVLRTRRMEIERFIKIYEQTHLGEIYDVLGVHRKEVVEPLIISDKEYIRRWSLETYQGKYIEKGANNIVTERGECVRSKSEKIIADKLYAMGIPYRYECPITLKGGIRVYPDFTLLKMPERKEIYLEHFGLLDEENYIESTMRKLHSYGENGIYLGDTLLITYETAKYPLSTKVLDGVLRSVFCNN